MNDALINRLLTYLTQPASASQNQLGPQVDTWRSRLPGTYVDRNGQLQLMPAGPNFRAFGDPLNDTRDNMEMNYQGFGHPMRDWPGGGWAPGGAYQMPPQWWAGPDRET